MLGIAVDSFDECFLLLAREPGLGGSTAVVFWSLRRFCETGAIPIHQAYWEPGSK
jgi:hypothetical protein